MIKQRILGLILTFAMFATAASFFSSARAADESRDLDVSASVADVLEISVLPSAFTFGTDLNFQGDNAAYYACPGVVNGATYLGPFSPGIVISVASNNHYDLDRTAVGDFPANRIFVKESAWVDCADNALNRHALQASDDIGGGNATTGDSYTDFYSFDVRVADSSGDYSVTITYTATAA